MASMEPVAFSMYSPTGFPAVRHVKARCCLVNGGIRNRRSPELRRRAPVL